MKPITIVILMFLAGCASTPPIDIHGHAPPQKLVKGPSAVLIGKRIVMTSSGPVQVCDYTVTLAEKFSVAADICQAYIPVPKEVIADIEAHPDQKPRSIQTTVKLLPYNTWNTSNNESSVAKPEHVYGTPIPPPIVH